VDNSADKFAGPGNFRCFLKASRVCLKNRQFLNPLIYKDIIFHFGQAHEFKKLFVTLL
jgi:hypothetical protein